MKVNELIEHLQNIVNEDESNGELTVICNELIAEYAIVDKEDITVTDGHLELF